MHITQEGQQRFRDHVRLFHRGQVARGRDFDEAGIRQRVGDSTRAWAR